jgi:hypothetical protein
MTTKSDTYNYAQNPLGGGNYTTITAAGLQSTVSGAKATSSSTQDNVTAWATSNYTFLSDHTSQITVGTLGNFDWPGAAVRLSTTGSGQGYVAYYLPEGTAVNLYKLTLGTVGAGTSHILQITGITLTSGDTLKLGCVGTTLTVYHNGTSIGSITDATYTSGQPGIAYEWGNVNSTLITAWSGTDAASGAPVLSSPTPSGTLNTTTAATLGCTSTVAAGTIYGVIDTAGHISGITAAQVVAGENNTSGAAAFFGNASVSSTTPSLTLTGLAPNTTYSYALAQSSSGNSNVVTGTFTTGVVYTPFTRTQFFVNYKVVQF